MYNIERKNQLVKEFCDNVDLNMDYLKCYCNLDVAVKNGDVEMVKNFMNEVSRVMLSSVPEEVEVPGVTVYPLFSGEDAITLIDVTLRNKYSAEYAFKIKRQIVVSDDIFEMLIDFFKCGYVELLTDAIVRENLVVVNAKLDEIAKEAGNTFKVEIVSPMTNDGKKLAFISDEKVVYVAEEERVLSMDDILVFAEPSEFVTEDMITEGMKREVAAFAQAQTTPQFVGVHEPLVEHICGLNSLTKAFTLIKKVNSKNVMKLRGSKETLAFFSKDKVYSVLSVTTEGKEVILKPFNVDTLEVVDMDVLKEIEA